MILELGLRIHCIIIFSDHDESDINMIQSKIVTFYNIATIYDNIYEMHGKGSIIVSDGLEYFTRLNQNELHILICATKAQEKKNFNLN